MKGPSAVLVFSFGKFKFELCCTVRAGGSLSFVTDLAIEAKQWECWFGGGGGGFFLFCSSSFQAQQQQERECSLVEEPDKLAPKGS